MVATVTQMVLVTCDERLQSSGDRLPFTNRSIDEVQEVGVGVTGVQVGCFTGVNHRAPAHCHKHVERVVLCKRDGVFKTETEKLKLQLLIGSSLTIQMIKHGTCTNNKKTRMCLDDVRDFYRLYGDPSLWWSAPANQRAGSMCTWCRSAPHARCRTLCI